MLKYKKGDLIYFANYGDNFYGIIDEFYADDRSGVYLLSAENFRESAIYNLIFKSENTEYDIIPNDILNEGLKLDTVTVQANDIRLFLSGGLNFSEMSDDRPLPFDLKCKRRVKLTSELMAAAALRSLETKEPADKLRSFIQYIFAVTKLCVLPDKDEEKSDKLFGIGEEAEKILCPYDIDVINYVINEVSKNPSGMTIAKLENFYEFLKMHNEGKKLDIDDRDYPDFVMENFIEKFGEKDAMNSASDREIMLYRIFTDRLADKGNKTALKKKAMGCFGHGNRAYEQDFKASLECLERLYAIDGDPFVANFIGSIYLHGYAGETDYKKAYEYFSVGALAGYYESIYSMGDIFRNGLGVKRQPAIANKLYSDVYNATFDDFRQKRFDYEFADAAYRLGLCYMDGIGCDIDYFLALLYFLQADFAVKKRLETADWYGDERLAENIKENIKELEKELGDVIDKKSDHISKDYPWLCGNLTAGTRRVEALYRRIGTDEIKFTLAILEHDGTRSETKVLVTIPELEHVELSDEIYFYADKVEDFWCMNTGRFVFNHVVYNSYFQRHEFYLFDELQAFIDAKKYTYHISRLKKSELFIRFAAVSFEGSDKTYNYICDDENIGIGDKAVVSTADGDKTVTVENIFVLKESELILPLGRYREIKRKA